MAVINYTSAEVDAIRNAAAPRDGNLIAYWDANGTLDQTGTSSLDDTLNNAAAEECGLRWKPVTDGFANNGTPAV